MKQGLRFDRGRISCVEGKGMTRVKRTVINCEQVEAIRMVVRDEIQKMNDEAEKIDEQAYRDGFDPFDGI